MPLLKSNFDVALKENYIEPLNDQVYRATVMLDRLEKNSKNVSGRYAYVPIVTSRNAGVGARGNTSGRNNTSRGPKIPRAGKQTYDAFTFDMIYHYGRGSVDGPTIRSSKDKNTAFANALDEEMQGLSKSLPEDLNQQIWAYGNGRKCSINDTAATASLTFWADSRDIFQLKVGDRLHMADITDGTIQTVTNALTVANITLNIATNKHLVEFAPDPSGAGDTMAKAVDAFYGGSDDGSAMTTADSTRRQALHGIPALIDDGDIGVDQAIPVEGPELLSGSIETIGGIDRDATSIIQSPVLRHSTQGTLRPLTVGLMQQAFMRAVAVEGTSPSDMDIYTNPSLWTTFGMLHVGDRIYNDYQETLEGGWIALKFNGRPVMYDKDAPVDVIWFLDMSTLMLLTQTGYEFLDDDGNKIRNVADYDEWEFTLVRDIQLGIRAPRRNVKLDDIEAAVEIQGVN